ncbi:MAG: hypothetical protein ACJATM_001310 [Alphaproteobacteria bacterium]|jgi:hypothetical protein
MCKEDFEIFRVSNRGTNVFEHVTDTTYSVNVPGELRKPNKKILIEVIDGTVEILTSTTFRTYMELGVSCNFTRGFDTEVISGFNSKNMEHLFNVDMYEYKLANVRHPFKIHSQCSFLLDTLPEKLIFSRYVVTTGLAVPLEFNGYISFILKLTYFDR